MSRTVRQLARWLALPVLCVTALTGVLAIIARPGTPRYELASYSTSLRGRLPSQRHNAALACRALDYAVVRPGQVFSFNRRVGSWTKDRGYVRAPVSYEGVLVEAVGGGVCQVSTTLYNAVLLAGLSVVERHPHAVAPLYVPPGRDAAVAHEALDLRFRNDYRWPVLIRAEVTQQRITVRLYGSEAPDKDISISTRILAHIAPVTYVLGEDGCWMPARGNRRSAGRGADGWRVVTYRVFRRAGEEYHRERLSEDRYEPVHVGIRPAQQFTVNSVQELSGIVSTSP